MPRVSGDFLLEWMEAIESLQKNSSTVVECQQDTTGQVEESVRRSQSGEAPSPLCAYRHEGWKFESGTFLRWSLSREIRNHAQVSVWNSEFFVVRCHVMHCWYFNLKPQLDI